MTLKQTFFVPEHIHVELRNKSELPLHQADIILGIKTHATYRNDIDISPLVSNENGLVNITKSKIMELASEFILGGIMDYSTLESAEPNIEIYFWGKRNINMYLGYEIDPNLEASLRFSIPNFDVEHFKKQRIEQMKQEKDYKVFNNCFNRKTSIADNLICIRDSWSKPQKEVHYKITLPF